MLVVLCSRTNTFQVWGILISGFYIHESLPNLSLINVNSLFSCLFLLVICYFVCRVVGVASDKERRHLEQHFSNYEEQAKSEVSVIAHRGGPILALHPRRGGG